MATLCRPSVSVPEHVITMEETLELARRRPATIRNCRSRSG
ncbi:hypothetical protein SVIOM342S_01467 [Streptomyces violaceorubidus]